MYDNFHAHLAWTNLKTQESNMYRMLKELYPYIFTEETYMLHNDLEMISLKSVKDMDSSTNWRMLCFFAFILSIFSKHAEDPESSKPSKSIPTSLCLLPFINNFGFKC